MKRTILILILFLASTAAALAAGGLEISGKVVDAASGEPVPGVIVRLDENYLWAITDEDGEFELEGVQKGTYALEVSCLGYVTYTREIKVTRDIEDIVIKISENTLALKEVVVTAETSKDNLNTTQKIGRTALDHLQMSGMDGIAALLPGGKTINPDLTQNNALSLRAAGSDAGNAAFSTAVEVNGVRMGDNANFAAMAGIGTRSISVENIESVEVITGVPSAEYGDLGSGMVRVTTKKGRTPWNIVFAVNPRTYEVSASKGFEIGKGVMNVGLEWANATSKLTSPYTSYTRRGFTLDYTRTFAKVLRLEAGLNGNIGGMNSKSDPDAFSEAYSKVNDNLLTPHFKLTWLLNRSWVTNLTLEGSVYFHDSRSLDHAYNSNAAPLPAVHATQMGYWMADALPTTYYSDQIVDSKELDYSASLKYHWLHHWGAVKGFLEDNVTIPIGPTKLNLMAGLRYENVFVAGSMYNGLNILSPRFNAKWELSKSVSLRGGWGVAGKLPSFYILYPKPEYRDIRTIDYSHGSSASYIYYTQPYRMEYNPELRWQRNQNAEVGLDIDWKGFKIGLVGFSNITKAPYEMGTVYTPFSYNIYQVPAGYAMPDNPQVQVDHQTGMVYFMDPEGYYVPSELKLTDRSFAASRRQENGADIHRYGMELTVDFPEIKPIKTTFRLDAAWNHTQYTSNVSSNLYRDGWSHSTLPGRSYEYAAIYRGGTNVYNGRITDNVDANLTAITHIPRARMVITVRLEAALLRNSRYTSDKAFTVDDKGNMTGGNIYDGNSYTAIYPDAYMDLDGVVHPWTSQSAQDPALQRLIIRSGNIYTFAQDGYNPYMCANLSVTKEIGDHVSLSFFANNFTNARPMVTSRATGVSAIFTPNFYYGLRCRIKF